MSAWLADYEWEACVAAAAAKRGRVAPDDFLQEVVEEAMSVLHPTQPTDDLSFFSVDDLTEDDRKRLLERGGFDVEATEILAIITAMPAHTIISDGTAKRVAERTLGDLLGTQADFADLELFARTGAISEQLRDQVTALRLEARGPLKEDLERLERYLESDNQPTRGPLGGWDRLIVPDWVDHTPPADYLAASVVTSPELGR